MYEIVFELVAPLCAGEPSREFIHVINGEIRKGDSKLAVGRISVVLVQVGRVTDRGGDLFEIMDGESPQLGDFMRLCLSRMNVMTTRTLSDANSSTSSGWIC